MAATQQRLTLGEFLKLSEEEPALEFEDGRVIQKPLPKGQHSGLQGALVEFFNRVARRRKLACAFPELRSTFAGHSYVPDVSVYRWDRIPRQPSGRVANDFFEPPDIAVEIVSPEQSVNALIQRCLWYVANGVRVALLVDPGDDSVRVFRPGHPPELLATTDHIDLRDVLPSFRMAVKQLFDALQVS